MIFPLYHTIQTHKLYWEIFEVTDFFFIAHVWYITATQVTILAVMHLMTCSFVRSS